MSWNSFGIPLILSLNPATTTNRYVLLITWCNGEQRPNKSPSQLYQMLLHLVKTVFSKDDAEEMCTDDGAIQPEVEVVEGSTDQTSLDANAPTSANNQANKNEEMDTEYPFTLSFGTGFSDSTTRQVPIDDQIIGSIPQVRLLPFSKSEKLTTTYLRVMDLRHPYFAIGLLKE